MLGKESLPREAKRSDGQNHLQGDDARELDNHAGAADGPVPVGGQDGDLVHEHRLNYILPPPQTAAAGGQNVAGAPHEEMRSAVMERLRNG